MTTLWPQKKLCGKMSMLVKYDVRLELKNVILTLITLYFHSWHITDSKSKPTRNIFGEVFVFLSHFSFLFLPCGSNNGLAVLVGLLVGLSVCRGSLCILSVYEGNRGYTIDGLIYPMMLINYWWKKLFLAAAKLYKYIDGPFFFFSHLAFWSKCVNLSNYRYCMLSWGSKKINYW